jgi:hypothetical protein
MKDVATLKDRIAASLNKAKVAREFPISHPMLLSERRRLMLSPAGIFHESNPRRPESNKGNG